MWLTKRKMIEFLEKLEDSDQIMLTIGQGFMAKDIHVSDISVKAGLHWSDPVSHDYYTLESLDKLKKNESIMGPVDGYEKIIVIDCETVMHR